MLCGLIMIILSFLLLANDLEAKETIKEYTEPFIDEYSEFDNCIFDDRQSGWYACLSIAEGTYEKNYKSWGMAQRTQKGNRCKRGKLYHRCKPWKTNVELWQEKQDSERPRI